MRKIFQTFITFATFMTMISSAQAGFRDSSQPGTPAGIWSRIPFAEGADFKEFTNTIEQSRDSVRKELLDEYGSLLIPLVQAGADVGDTSKALAEVIQTFDGMYGVHKADAIKHLGFSLESIFKTEFDQLYRRLGLPESVRRVRFIDNAGTDPKELLSEVDFLMYGSFTVSRPGKVILTLTLEKYLTGETRSFNAESEIHAAIQDLARQVFNFFQSEEYPAWMNPQSQLTWIVPPPSAIPATTPAAVQYCRGQGARLPYVRELILAAQGSQYQSGGIAPLENGAIYPVADRQRYNEQYYYFAGSEETTGGAVRTDAGFGTIKDRFYCVKGTPSQEVNFVESIYRIWRKSQDAKIRSAIDYLLTQMSDFSARPESRETFSSSDDALALLRANGIVLDIPAGLLSGD